MSSGTSHEQAFAKVYNDLKNYPTLADVATALGRSYQTVRNYSVILRSRAAMGMDVPVLISRASGKSVSPAPEEETLSPVEHARKRADGVNKAMGKLFTSSDWPVINPEALVTAYRTANRYNRSTGEYDEVAGTPRTWLTDTLRVADIEDVRHETFIFTGAQNDAPIDEAFWQNLTAYAEFLGARIAVGPWTYETNWWDENSPTAREYDPRIERHLCFGQLKLGKSFMFGGEMNTLPTSPRPIADLTSYTQGRWGVFPHARLQLLSVPSTVPGEQAYQIMTTGAVTRSKVIPRKAGIKSIFHHVIGATIVEFDGEGRPFCRQLLADTDGSFYDLEYFVDRGAVGPAGPVRAITVGDLHLAKLKRDNALATLGFDYRSGETAPDSLIATLKPEHVFFEDIHDNESRNHHHVKDVSHNFEMAMRNRSSVKAEVMRTVTFLEQFQELYPDTKIHVVESNHDVALERYIREGRYRDMDGENLTYGLKLDLAYHEWREQVGLHLDADAKPPKFSMLEFAVRDLAGTCLDAVHWIYDGSDSCILDGVELGHHGHRGSNGAHGSAAGFARLGRPMTIGDKHSPQILDLVFVSGVMELQQGYNKGPSGWAVSDVIQYPNGKRTLITLQNGNWRAN